MKNWSAGWRHKVAWVSLYLFVGGMLSGIYERYRQPKASETVVWSLILAWPAVIIVSFGGGIGYMIVEATRDD